MFDASVTALIPLYAIGVFLSFSLSQWGMARRWWKIGHMQPGTEIHEKGSVLHYDAGWQWKLVVNFLGGVSTFVVMLIFAVTKFKDGAWIILLVVPALVLVFFAINHHYRELAKSLSLDDYGAPPAIRRHRVIVPISGVHRGSLAALDYALSLSSDVTAVHISIDAAEAEKLQAKWERWGNGVRLVILESPYRLLLEPLLGYVEHIAELRQPAEVITIVVPQFITHQKAFIFIRIRLRRCGKN